MAVPKSTQTRFVGVITSSIHALRMTRASSQNVGKFYRTGKLSAENLRLFHTNSN